MSHDENATFELDNVCTVPVNSISDCMSFGVNATSVDYFEAFFSCFNDFGSRFVIKHTANQKKTTPPIFFCHDLINKILLT